MNNRMSIISEIMSACDDIVLQYNDSKYPKFVKRIIFESNINKIDKLINKLNNIDISGLVIEYIRLLLKTYPPFGKFKHCVSVKSINDSHIGAFEYDISKDDKYYHVIANVIESADNGFNSNYCSIRINIYYNGFNQLSFFISLNELIPEDIDMKNRLEAISAKSRIEFQKIIQEDIIEFLSKYVNKCKVSVNL